MKRLSFVGRASNTSVTEGERNNYVVKPIVSGNFGKEKNRQKLSKKQKRPHRSAGLGIAFLLLGLLLTTGSSSVIANEISHGSELNRIKSWSDRNFSLLEIAEPPEVIREDLAKLGEELEQIPIGEMTDDRTVWSVFFGREKRNVQVGFLKGNRMIGERSNIQLYWDNNPFFLKNTDMIHSSFISLTLDTDLIPYFRLESTSDLYVLPPPDKKENESVDVKVTTKYGIIGDFKSQGVEELRGGTVSSYFLGKVREDESLLTLSDMPKFGPETFHEIRLN
jgi:hypothetical protein